MLQYIQTLLPRLKQFSSSLDRQENFIGKPWIFIDESGRQHTYIFQRDNSLIMSLNGQVTIGRWDYIPAAQSLLIDRIKDKVLLNQGFIDSGIMILKTDGTASSMTLMNKNEIPDLNGERYLKEAFIKNLKLKALIDGDKRYYYADPDDTGITSSTKFFDEDLNPVSTFLTLRGGRNFEIVDGIVRKYWHSLRIDTDKGALHTKSTGSEVSIGDETYFGDNFATDGYYKVSNPENIKAVEIKNGRVSIIHQKINRIPVALLIIAVLVIAGLIIFKMNQGPKEFVAEQVDSTVTVQDSTKVDTLATVVIDSIPGINTIDNTASSVSNSKQYFSIGSSENEVIAIQGEPTRVTKYEYLNETVYAYGLSTITFRNGKVYSYSNSDGNLQVRLRPNYEENNTAPDEQQDQVTRYVFFTCYFLESNELKEYYSKIYVVKNYTQDRELEIQNCLHQNVSFRHPEEKVYLAAHTFKTYASATAEWNEQVGQEILGDGVCGY